MLGDTLTGSLWITTVTTDDLFPFALALVATMTASDSLGVISSQPLFQHCGPKLKVFEVAFGNIARVWRAYFWVSPQRQANGPYALDYRGTTP